MNGSNFEEDSGRIVIPGHNVPVNQYAGHRRENVFYYPHGCNVDPLPSLLENCQKRESETWSPLSSDYKDYGKICQEITVGKDNETVTNRFCTSFDEDNDDDSLDTIDWSKVEEMVPKCLSTGGDCNISN